MTLSRQGFALVTPASRGIGFAFARQLLVHTDLPICITARNNCDELHEKLVGSVRTRTDTAKRLTVVKVDVTGR